MMTTHESMIDRIARGQEQMLSTTAICKLLKISRPTFDRWRAADSKQKFPPLSLKVLGIHRWTEPHFKTWLKT